MHLLSHIDDHQLLAQLKEGSEHALTLLYKKYWQQLYSSAYAVLKDGQACEDIIQELFLKLWLKRGELEIAGTLSSYLSAWVRYDVYRVIRSGKARENIFDDLHDRLEAAPAANNIEFRELSSQINSIVEKLPEKCRAVYKLSREEHLSHKQIAAQMNISTKTVENHLTKALHYMRVSLSQVVTLEMIAFLMQS